MKNLAQTAGSAVKQQFTVNPFAKALAETESGVFDSVPNQSLNPFSEALAKTGSSFSDAVAGSGDQSSLLEQQKKEILANQEKELLRKKLHDQVNPVDTTEVFLQEELRTKKALEKIRQELVLLVEDIKQFRAELAIATQQRVVNPGIQGTYHYNFFNQLRNFIVLLRQQVKSARTWLHTSNGKKQKVATMRGHRATKAVHDMQFHEQKMAFAGG